MKKLVLVAVSVAAFASFAHAEDKKVIRTEKTGKERVMVVGHCTPTSNQDFEGKIRVGFQHGVTKCVEYRSYEAIQSGKWWNRKYQKIGPETLSYKMVMDNKDFSNYYSTKDAFDELLVSATLMSQCVASRTQLTALADDRACQ